ncbi:MAG: carboxylesterase family protein [Anaerolineales bacterium]|nr:carboxylesterase family protein [Anaerolineales bacterium]
MESDHKRIVNPDHKPTITSECIAKTQYGRIQGSLLEDIYSFKGIPYAAPPSGELRWRPPQPPEAWSGIRQTQEYGLSCIQMGFGDMSMPQSENCLSLNIWTSALSNTANMPVMVWIPGGGFHGGSSASPLYRYFQPQNSEPNKDYSGISGYDGANLARKGVVVVTINYRVNLFGFLSHPELERETEFRSGSYGILDQVAALEWVRDNIEGFGGNPGNVTIFGQSAGGWSIYYLQNYDTARNLFHKAIAQSGGFLSNDLEIFYTGDRALQVGLELQKRAGCKNIAEMRNLPPKKLIEAAKDMWFWPSIDRTFGMTEHQFYQSKEKYRPMIIGICKQESSRIGSLYKYEPNINTINDYMTILKDKFGDNADKAFNQFPAPSENSAYWSIVDMDTIFSWWKPKVDLVENLVQKGNEVYSYRFSRVPPTEWGKSYGASHSAELPYLFGQTPQEVGFEQEDCRLSEAMQEYWVQFAKTGNPNKEGLPKWPHYQLSNKMTLDFDTTIQVGQLWHTERDFIEENASDNYKQQKAAKK